MCIDEIEWIDEIERIEEIEWIVNTLKQSYRKSEVEPEKENKNLYRDRHNLDE